jgi:putative tryptophan/tyrosine transport system substrate-binding protein
MRRREFIKGIAGSAAAWPLAVHAQSPSKVLRVGIISPSPRSRPQWQALEHRLTDLGYRDGANYIMDYINISRVAEADYKAGYLKLMERDADIIVAVGPEISLRAAIATVGTRPIVMVAIDYDPLDRGYVESLAHPGGNVTGVFLQQIELAEKRVQILLEAFPDIRAATGFWDAVSTDQWKATQLAAQKLGLKLAGIEFRKPPYDYERALAQVPPDHRDALIAMTSPTLVSDRSQLSEFAIKHRMRSMGVVREYADAGCLLTYGANLAEMYARAADYIDRIAKGTLPADLPIQLPTKFELVVNLKTAKALGISLSPMLIARADEVIE